MSAALVAYSSFTYLSIFFKKKKKEKILGFISFLSICFYLFDYLLLFLLQ